MGASIYRRICVSADRSFAQRAGRRAWEHQGDVRDADGDGPGAGGTIRPGAAAGATPLPESLSPESLSLSPSP